jgi:hypothetical protein
MISGLMRIANNEEGATAVGPNSVAKSHAGR